MKTILVAIFFLLATTLGFVSAEPQIQVFDQSGNPIQLDNMPTQVLNLQQGQIYTGQVNEPTTVTGNIENLFVSVSNDGTTKFQFKVPPFQSELVVGAGQSSTTFLIEPKAEDLIAGLTVEDLIGVAILVGIIFVAILIWRKRQN